MQNFFNLRINTDTKPIYRKKCPNPEQGSLASFFSVNDSTSGIWVFCPVKI